MQREIQRSGEAGSEEGTGKGRRGGGGKRVMSRREEAGLAEERRGIRRSGMGRGGKEKKAAREGLREKGRVVGECELKMTRKEGILKGGEGGTNGDERTK